MNEGLQYAGSDRMFLLGCLPVIAIPHSYRNDNHTGHDQNQ